MGRGASEEGKCGSENFPRLKGISHQKQPASNTEPTLNRNAGFQTIIFIHCFLLTHKFLKILVKKNSQNIPQAANIEVAERVFVIFLRYIPCVGRDSLLALTMTSTVLSGKSPLSPGATDCPQPVTENRLNLSRGLTSSRCAGPEDRPCSRDTVRKILPNLHFCQKVEVFFVPKREKPSRLQTQRTGGGLGAPSETRACWCVWGDSAHAPSPFQGASLQFVPRGDQIHPKDEDQSRKE